MTDAATDDPTALADERTRVTALLQDAELRAARVPVLERRIGDLEYQLAETQADLAKARREVWELDQLLMYSRRVLRHVRPLIGPLREARRRLRS